MHRSRSRAESRCERVSGVGARASAAGYWDARARHLASPSKKMGEMLSRAFEFFSGGLFKFVSQRASMTRGGLRLRATDLLSQGRGLWVELAIVVERLELALEERQALRVHGSAASPREHSRCFGHLSSKSRITPKPLNLALCDAHSWEGPPCSPQFSAADTHGAGARWMMMVQATVLCPSARPPGEGLGTLDCMLPSV